MSKLTSDNLQQTYTGAADVFDAPVYLIYLRHSTEDSQGSSFDDQYGKCRRIVEALGFSVSNDPVLIDYQLAPSPDQAKRYIGAFGDRDKGVTPLTDRAKFSMLIKYVEERQKQGRPIRGIVVNDMSRLTRLKGLDGMAELILLKRLGLMIIDADQLKELDYDETANLVVYTVKSEGNYNEARNAAIKTMDRMAAMTEAGLWTGGSPPPGYITVPAHDHPSRNKQGTSSRLTKSGDPRHEEAIPKLFRMCLDGVGLSKICDYANEMGLGTVKRKDGPACGTITLMTLVHTILRNRIYAGVQEYPKQGRKAWRPKKRKPTVGWGDRPPVKAVLPELAYVSEELFDMVQRRLDEEAPKKGNGGVKRLLTGILKCPVHGTQMYHDSLGSYRCKHASCEVKAVPAHIAEAQLTAAFLHLTCNRPAVQEMVEQYAPRTDDNEAMMLRLEQELVVTARKKDSVRSAYRENLLTEQQYLHDLRQLESARVRIEGEMEEVHRTAALSVNDVLMVGHRFLLADKKEKNRLMRAVFKRAVFRAEDHTLTITTNELLFNLNITASPMRVLVPSIDESLVAQAASAARRIFPGLLSPQGPSAEDVEAFRRVAGDPFSNWEVKITTREKGAVDAGQDERVSVGWIGGERGKPHLWIDEISADEPGDESGDLKENHCGGRI